MAKEEKKDTSWKGTMESLEKEFGKGTVMSFADKSTGQYDTISTGSIGFDDSTDVGGFARSRMYELMGWEGTGKTTICGHLCANAQKKYPNEKVVYIDGEHALDKSYFEKLGVDTNRLFIAQPTCGEEGFEIAKRLIETGEVSLCIIDSDTSMKPRSEVEGEIGDNAIGKKARLNSQAYGILHVKAKDFNTCLVIISQYREKIGVMFGNPTTTTGGHALKFFADVRIEMSKSLVKDGDEIIANKTKIKIVKNKIGRPFRKCEFDIIYGEGINTLGEIIELGSEAEILKKYGSKITYGDNKYTIEEFKEMLKSNPDFYAEIKEKLRGVASSTHGED